MKIMMIDNYDSFTYNLVQYLGEMGHEIRVERNDQVTLSDIEQITPDVLMISPGPRTPDEAGVSLEAIRHFASKLPILGVCLGHQAIAQAFGARIIQAPRLMHGKISEIRHDGKTVFQGLPNPFTATRYHSLIVDPTTLSSDFIVSAQTDDGEIMAIRHRQFPLEGVQFHPESILTKQGKALLDNFLQTYQPHPT